MKAELEALLERLERIETGKVVAKYENGMEMVEVNIPLAELKTIVRELINILLKQDED